MRKAFVRAAIIIIWLATPLCWSQSFGQIWGPRLTIAILEEVEQKVTILTNEIRQEHGLPRLQRDEILVRLARDHSSDMLGHGFFSHVTPEGKSLQERLASHYALPVSRAGENIWSGSGHDYTNSQQLAKIIVNSWMSSPGHRENILLPQYTHLGVGIVAAGREARATQIFVQVSSRR